MKRTLFSILSMTILSLTYGQGIKTEKEKFRLVTAGKMQVGPDKSLTFFSEGVVINVPDKLDIEADSALYDKGKNLLTTYGTKSFTFNGRVVVGKQQSRICRFRLGEDTLTIE